MFEHIEKMKGKPEHIRRKYAFVVSFSISALIFVGWIASYGFSNSPVLADTSANTTKDVNGAQTNSKETQSAKVDSPISSLSASAVGVFDDVKSIIFGSNKTEYSSQIEIVGGER
jgi:hypothetical protein